ncbi:MAG TPA: NAD(P)/FAD-dependent oxidoreductase [Microlunatus sp.]|nr:NAD(P)/FAD-dependent oxidoreductase [Microlunatus sp.]
MPERYDAVIIGAGPNGLVAANLLADRGWQVLVLDSQPEPGGAVRSARDVHPDYVHDTFSAFYPLAAASPVLRRLGLEHHGLAWRHAPAVVGHPRQDGSWALLHRDPELTAAEFDRAGPGDGAAWLELWRTWRRIGPDLVSALLSPIPPVRGGAKLLAKLPFSGGLAVARTLLEPVTTLTGLRFGGAGPQLLLGGLAGHADIPLGAPGSGLMGLLLAMLGHSHGFPVPQGGASALPDALARRFVAAGGTLRCDTRVTGIRLVDGRVTGVEIEGADRVPAPVVIATVPAPTLYTRLIDPALLPRRVSRALELFDPDPATIKVDWALDGPVPWAEPPPVAPGTVHLAGTPEEQALAHAAVHHQVLPEQPNLVLGQMAVADPGRAPAGAESLWAYTHVPRRVRLDLAGKIGDGWSPDDTERMADRMQSVLARYAPELESRIVARRVLGPDELERRDPSLVGGAINGGTAGLHQQLIFRPIPGLGRAETPFRGLFLGGSSAHPGGGVHGACGANAARAALLARRLRRVR